MEMETGSTCDTPFLGVRQPLAFFLAVLLTTGCGTGGLTRKPPTEAELPLDTRLAAPVNIVTYNTHLLPDFVHRVAGRIGKGDYRATAIPARLAGYDILGLCETFDPNRTDVLVAAFESQPGTQWHVLRSPARGERASAGGLTLVTRYPLEDSHWLRFEAASGLLQDGLAAKGVLHARLRLVEGEHGLIDCFLTHLDSQSQNVRLAQVRELAAFMAEHGAAERPLILLGDLNITADPPGTTYEPLGEDERPTAYRWLMEGLQPTGQPLLDVWTTAAEGPGNTLYDLDDGGGRRVDYILLSQPQAAPAVSLEVRSTGVLPLKDSEVPEGVLSDHAAVECRVELLWPAK